MSLILTVLYAVSTGIRALLAVRDPMFLAGLYPKIAGPMCLFSLLGILCLTVFRVPKSKMSRRVLIGVLAVDGALFFVAFRNPGALANQLPPLVVAIGFVAMFLFLIIGAAYEGRAKANKA